MPKRSGKATVTHCNPYSFGCGFCVHNVKLGLSNKLVQSLGGQESPGTVDHYVQSLGFEEALRLHKSVNSDA